MILFGSGACLDQLSAKYIELLSPDAERPSSRLLPHSGARCEILDLREIYGAGTRDSACSSGGALRAGGRSPRPSGNVCAEPLRLEGCQETRGVPSSGVGPSQNGTCSGCGIARNCRAGRSTVFSVREDQSLYNASQSAPSGRMGSFGTDPQQTVVSWWLIEQNVFGGWYVSVARYGPGKVP